MIVELRSLCGTTPRFLSTLSAILTFINNKRIRLLFVDISESTGAGGEFPHFLQTFIQQFPRTLHWFPQVAFRHNGYDNIIRKSYKKIHTSHYIMREREREMFYLTTHSTHFIYSYMASDIWLRTILIVREETRCRLIGYSFRLAARVLLYAPSHRQDNTYHSLCYTVMEHWLE